MSGNIGPDTLDRRRGKTDSGAKEQNTLGKEIQGRGWNNMKVYEEYLGEPNSPLAQKLLHTNYFERSQINGKVIREKTHKH